jgi:hypothetical protein
VSGTVRAEAVLADLWRLAGLAPHAADVVALTGEEPVLPSSFRIGTAAQATIAAAALAAAEVWRRRTGRAQVVSVTMRAGRPRRSRRGRPKRGWR